MTQDYIRPLTFGGLTIENNLFQAPLAGYSSPPFRLLTWTLGRPGLLATEMISARALQLQSPRQERYLRQLDGEGPIAYQIWGNDPEAIAYATKVVTDRGATVVDLNCGCPVRKVRAAGAGSKLMDDPLLIGRLIKAMRQNTSLPVTIKIRVGTNHKNFNGLEITRIAEAEGVDLVTVHGRHAKEAYATPCRYDKIAEIVAGVSIPIIGNGDAHDGPSTARLFDETGCAGVMVGRACMGAPWIFRQIQDELTGQTPALPALQTIGQILLDHHDMMIDEIGEDMAVRHCRKLGSFYSRAIPGAKAFRNGLNHCLKREDLKNLIEEYFGSKPEDLF